MLENVKKINLKILFIGQPKLGSKVSTMTKTVTCRRGKTNWSHIAAKKVVRYNSKNSVVLLHIMPIRRSVNNDHIQEWMNQDEEKLLTDNTADLVSCWWWPFRWWY